MARTLNNILRKQRSPGRVGSISSTRIKLSEIRKRKSEELQRWMKPLCKKRNKSVVIVDSSGDEAASIENQSSERFSRGETEATAIEIDEDLDSEDDSESESDSNSNSEEEEDDDDEDDHSEQSQKIKAEEEGYHLDDSEKNESDDDEVESDEGEHAESGDEQAEDVDVDVDVDVDEEDEDNGNNSASDTDEDDSGPARRARIPRLSKQHQRSKQVTSLLPNLADDQCCAWTHRNTLCKRPSVDGTNVCRWHMRGMPYGSILDAEEQENSKPPRKNNSQDSKLSDAERDEVENDSEKTEERKLCAALTTKGKNCKIFAIDDSLYCRMHGQMLAKKKRESKNAKNDKSLTASASAPAQNKSDDEFDFDSKNDNTSDTEQDILYRKQKGQERCIAVTPHGNICLYQAVNSTVYCYYHGKNKHDELSPYSSTSISERERCSNIPKEDDSSSSDSDLSDSDDERSTYNYREFLKMWHSCEEYCGEVTEEIESTRRVRGANQKMSPEDTDGQLKAQYGRLLPKAMRSLMKDILCLQRSDVFLDIGHGIGNTCIQAAFTTGCEARGIEVVYGRNSVAEVFSDNLYAQNTERTRPRSVGKVELRHGRLEDLQHQEFLTKDVTRAYVNNFNGVFADRSSKSNQKWFLDDYVAALFAMMSPGAIMVTLHPLNLGPTKSEANATRKKQNLQESENASFYEVERLLLGKACDTVKWNQHSGNQHNIFVYKYTRNHQPVSTDAVFLCCNPLCQFAKDEIPISAVTTNEEDRCVINHCACKFTAKNLRRQRRKVYTDG